MLIIPFPSRLGVKFSRIRISVAENFMSGSF